VTLPPGRLIAVVGPNGAGKSNLLEAAAFAAGCGAWALRCAALRDVACTDCAGQVRACLLGLRRKAAGSYVDSGQPPCFIPPICSR
jgi:ABC-type hemin transport system ATPase subunit